LGALSSTASAADQGDPPAASTPGILPATSPIFSPKPTWLGTFSPSTVKPVSASSTASSSLGAPADAGLPPSVRSRADWNAAPPVQAYTPQVPKGVSLHHTGAPWYGKPGPEQYLRNIQAFHTGAEREWEDIAYHFLVDLDGVIWQGRPATVMGNPSIYYDPMGLVLISFLGDYMVQEPTDTQLASSAATAAWLIKKYNMPLTTVDGHRDHAPTSCPGDNLYRTLKDGTFGDRVKDALAKLA
jgi:hypothetical protein